VHLSQFGAKLLFTSGVAGWLWRRCFTNFSHRQGLFNPMITPKRNVFAPLGIHNLLNYCFACDGF
jgi:hypothetical protein